MSKLLKISGLCYKPFAYVKPGNPYWRVQYIV